mgnify:CR=1 FL=1
MKVSRRTVFGGAAVAAAAVIVPSAASAAIDNADRKRLADRLARGGLIDEKALFEALKAGKVAGASEEASANVQSVAVTAPPDTLSAPPCSVST